MRIRLVREYPLKKITKLTLNNVYEVLEDIDYSKQVTSRFSVPIKIYSIRNDEGVVISVNALFFELV